ncbi:interleukin-12 receptor subunit beta-2 isoform X1 [Xyrichtys novacula]|nr:interleukin-12 receptor subunit beta-2 isoform X1 [Xyrichtys novacula]
MYMCEWTMNTTESDVTFDFYFNEEKFGPKLKQTSAQFREEELIKYETVYIWVEAHVGNSSCTSVQSPVILNDIVKYEAPQEISMSWEKDNLHLNWRAAEDHPALAEVRFLQHGDPTGSWESRIDTTKTNGKTSMFQVHLLRNISYQVKIRQRSTQALSPLWSDWSTVVDVPTELNKNPEVMVKTTLLNGTRKVKLTWKPMPHATAITGISFSIKDTQSSRGCPCAEKSKYTENTEDTIYVSNSPVNISVMAKNAAGHSPPTVIQLPAVKPASDLEACEETILEKKTKKVTCLEWYELQDEEQTPENVITLLGRQSKKERHQIKKDLKDFVRYLYFEHTCVGRMPRTDKMCIFYKMEEAPRTKPQDLYAFDETQDRSIELSWKAIPYADQRGYLTHYSLCNEKSSPEEEFKECHNISATLLKYRLKNLTPDTKYIISLAGVTRRGEGPRATIEIITQPEKTFNVWWSLGLLLVFFLISTLCTVILKRIRMKICPPVPTPVLDFTSYPREKQEMLERKEEVHKLTIHKLLPEAKSIPEETEEGTEGGTDENMENERGDSRMSGEISDEDSDCTDEALRSSREGEITDLENEFAMLTYRNGLVFDMKTDSP